MVQASGLVTKLHQELTEIGVKDPTLILPDDSDDITAAALEMLMRNEEPGIPDMDAFGLFLLDKRLPCDETAAKSCQTAYEAFYVNPLVREQVLAALARESQITIREQDHRQKEYTETVRHHEQ